MDLYEDVTQVTKDFQETVKTYPETIECHSQNKPISDIFSPNSEEWDSHKNDNPDDMYTRLSSGYNSKGNISGSVCVCVCVCVCVRVNLCLRRRARARVCTYVCTCVF